VREAAEETGLRVTLTEQFHTYSEPSRDPRKHVVTTVFIARARGEPRAGDDAAVARAFALGDWPELVFDHATVLWDYLQYRQTGERPAPDR
jgi:8-oxo-dGTP diphosphatase